MKKIKSVEVENLVGGLDIHIEGVGEVQKIGVMSEDNYIAGITVLFNDLSEIDYYTNKFIIRTTTFNS